MKTLHNPIIIGVISSMIIGGVIFVMFQTIISGPVDITKKIEILNLQVEPSTIKVGDTFAINATLINNSQNPIYVTYSSFCGSPFGVIFDRHVTVDSNNMLCAIGEKIEQVNPGEKIIKVAPDSLFAFRATQSGITNATVTFHIEEKKSTSKSFLFTILDK